MRDRWDYDTLAAAWRMRPAEAVGKITVNKLVMAVLDTENFAAQGTPHLPV